ncbi:hypothetical protein FQN50_004134 [Emmonsiellopsis sp. PD_5]|nr:hypothetical protein FQN50_004134 [Emmonsiellopsis sp. PD_5]
MPSLTTIFLFSFLIPLISAQDLLTALRTVANATAFADLIESTPELSTILLSPNIRTVFAPSNAAVEAFLATLGGSSGSLLPRANLNSEELDNLAYHGGTVESDFGSERNEKGGTISTALENEFKIQVPIVYDEEEEAGEGGEGDGDGEGEEGGSGGNSTRRMAMRMLRARQGGAGKGSLNLFGGLGDQAKVVASNIPFDGGRIHTMDVLLTLPLPLSTTTTTLPNLTTYSTALTTTNTTTTLHSTKQLTAFIPNDAAFAAANITSPSASLLDDHVITDFAGYLPTLTNGTSYGLKSGASVTVRIDADGTVWVGNARVVRRDVVLVNGVGHVVDAVITPDGPPPFEGRAASRTSARVGFIVALAAAVCGVGMMY